ncbi:hypothetical protein AHAS_Ahas02G0199300 [Arachis hypogaea]
MWLKAVLEPQITASDSKTYNTPIDASAAGKQKNAPITVLAGVPKENIEDKYLVDRELGRGEFGVTYLCIDRGSRELLACKSISKRKLRTAVDVEDVRRKVAIMRHLPRSSSIVSLREACEDDNAVHLVMELCEGGELFDRIVARGRYTERAAAVVARTVVEVVQLCHRHGVIHRDLKPENFLMANDEHLRKAFSYFDKDGNGYIEPDELRNALMEDGTDDCADVANDIFQEVDTDKVMDKPPYPLLFDIVVGKEVVFKVERKWVYSNPQSDNFYSNSSMILSKLMDQKLGFMVDPKLIGDDNVCPVYNV